MAMNPEFGGVGAPFVIANAAQEVIASANKSFSMCPGLTGLVEALEANASDALKEEYIPNLVSGEWTGTMCLTEPQAGTDLGLLTTRAEPFGDHYKLTGTKVWITFGEHNLTDNIVHLVLARLPDAPDGIKGISTFIVPKLLADGSRNPIFCGGTDHKMGIHASPTCVMNLEEAEGWLVGEPHKGMRSMFTMMNAARLQVGGEGVALGEGILSSSIGLRAGSPSESLLNQKQARPKCLCGQHFGPTPMCVGMLLNVKSTTEGLRGLVAWISMSYDIMHHSSDAAAKQKAGELVAFDPHYQKLRLGTRVRQYQRSHAGDGRSWIYLNWPVEQFLRDERIAMIYEGTNHIQALDLVGRKLPMNGGALMRLRVKSPL